MKRSLLVLSCLAWVGCKSTGDGSDDTDADTDVAAASELDVTVPDPEPDPSMLDFLSPPLDIEPYSEHMYCYYLPPLTEDLVADNLKAYQGQYGHHIVVLATKVPKEPGAMEDCSDAAQMPNFRPLVLPDTPLDPGYGVKLPAGTQLVMQIHYVNPTSKVLHTRDVARLHLVDPADVTTWAATFATNMYGWTLPPGETTTVAFDCELPANVTLLLMGGHMHEWGTRFETSLGTTEENMTQQYLVDPWVPEFRDAPPVSMFFENPMAIGEGVKLRTTCTWFNDQSDPIEFPSEMCSTFGYMGGAQEPFACGINE